MNNTTEGIARAMVIGLTAAFLFLLAVAALVMAIEIAESAAGVC